MGPRVLDLHGMVAPPVRGTDSFVATTCYLRGWSDCETRDRTQLPAEHVVELMKSVLDQLPGELRNLPLARDKKLARAVTRIPTSRQATYHAQMKLFYSICFVINVNGE